MPQRDEVDRIVEAWSRERPDLDFAPLHVLSRVGRLAKHLERARKAAFAVAGVEPWEFDVLSALRKAGAPYQLSPTALVQQTMVSSGTMTNRIDRERVDEAITSLVHDETALLSRMSPAEQERLSSLLRKLSLDGE